MATVDLAARLEARLAGPQLILGDVTEETVARTHVDRGSPRAVRDDLIFVALRPAVGERGVSLGHDITRARGLIDGRGVAQDVPAGREGRVSLRTVLKKRTNEHILYVCGVYGG